MPLHTWNASSEVCHIGGNPSENWGDTGGEFTMHDQPPISGL